jgi:WD40 repeat protein
MIQSWDLSNPNAPPVSFPLGQFAPYASPRSINMLLAIPDPAGPIIVAAGEDPSIRVWKPSATAPGTYSCLSTMSGHVRGVTAGSIVDGLLWTSSVDCNIRIWDPAAAECKHVIAAGQPAPQQGGNNQAPPPPPAGHTGPVACLEVCEHEGQKFVLTGSLDCTVRAWDASANQMICESHPSGVFSLCVVEDTGKNKLLVAGLEKGNIMVRHFVSAASEASA